MLLALAEHENGELSKLSLEMLTFCCGLAGRMAAPLEAVLVGEEAQPLAPALAAYGVSRVHLVIHEQLTSYAPVAWAASLAQIAAAQGAQAIVAAGSEHGNEVMAHLAASGDLPLAVNCIAVQPGDEYQVTRLRWGGSLLEEARLAGAPKLFTMAPHAHEATTLKTPIPLAVETFTPALAAGDLRVRVARREKTGGDKLSLTDARLVIGGGRGVGSSEGFAVLEELAALLGGVVGCSRAVTSAGWRPHSDQIGQTGTRIAPDLYIACGVSGAIQHMVGAKGAKRILAINTDRQAQIVALADYAVIGDLHQVIPAISAAVRQSKK
jgi:electron transfer flavoprotein alpha subunit